MGVGRAEDIEQIIATFIRPWRGEYPVSFHNASLAIATVQYDPHIGFPMWGLTEGLGCAAWIEEKGS